MPTTARDGGQVVLLIEDDATYATLIGFALPGDVEVLRADSLAAAMSLLAVHRVDMVVVDRALPDGDGVEIVGLLAEVPGAESVPVVVLTGALSAPDRLAVIRSGVVDYMTKDVGLDEIATRLGAHLAHRRRTLRAATAVGEGAGAEHARRAIDLTDIRPVFHAIIDLTSGETVGVEALSRFDDGVRPDEWFAAARYAGIAVEAELAALRRQTAAADDLPAGVFMSVNTSPETLIDGRIRDLLPASRSVVVELTEHLPIADYAAVQAALADIPDIRLAIDDAGAGYASLGHILALSPELVKIDRGWVAGIDRDPARQALVVGLMHFTDEIGALLVAEGVETEGELRVLQRLGVPLAQGFRFGQPGPVGTVPRHIDLR